VLSKVFTVVYVCPTGSFADDEGHCYTFAQFGEAGTWTTMNLRSTRYAASLGGATLTLTANNYPSRNKAILDAHPEYGLLYYWADATKRSGVSANESQTTQAGIDQSLPENQFQGICPNGWHVPSDYEWSELEKEIASNPTDYSTQMQAYADADSYDFFGSAGGDRPNSSTDETYWGRQMKSATPVNSQATFGTSKPAVENGFAVLLVGKTNDSVARDYGSRAEFWTCSSINGDNAHHRSFYSSSDAERRHDGDFWKHTNAMSVRCKKN
jgi:uncharacterized protein (TIGR02145 family)